MNHNARNIDTPVIIYGPKVTKYSPQLLPEQYSQSNLKFYKHVTIKQTNYKLGTILLAQMGEEDLPQFGRIVSIFEHKNTIMFPLKMFQTLYFYEHAYAFRVSEKLNQNVDFVVLHESLPYPFACAYVQKYIEMQFVRLKTLI